MSCHVFHTISSRGTPCVKSGNYMHVYISSFQDLPRAFTLSSPFEEPIICRFASRRFSAWFSLYLSKVCEADPYVSYVPRRGPYLFCLRGRPCFLMSRGRPYLCTRRGGPLSFVLREADLYQLCLAREIPMRRWSSLNYVSTLEGADSLSRGAHHISALCGANSLPRSARLIFDPQSPDSLLKVLLSSRSWSLLELVFEELIPSSRYLCLWGPVSLLEVLHSRADSLFKASLSSRFWFLSRSSLAYNEKIHSSKILTSRGLDSLFDVVPFPAHALSFPGASLR